VKAKNRSENFKLCKDNEGVLGTTEIFYPAEIMIPIKYNSYILLNVVSLINNVFQEWRKSQFR